MLAGVAQTVRRTVRGQFLIGKKFENGSGERLAVPRLDEQSDLPGLETTGSAPPCHPNRGAAAKKIYPKNDGKDYSAQRSARHNTASGKNIGRLPAIPIRKARV